VSSTKAASPEVESITLQKGGRRRAEPGTSGNAGSWHGKILVLPENTGTNNPQSPLTDSAYWDEVWADAPVSRERPRGWRRFLAELPADRQFWRDIVPRFAPKPPARVIEIGSAPGAKLLRWRDLFGYEVFGVDISERGLLSQRQLLASQGIGESHSIRADFLDPAFQRTHENRFDIAYSAGVIEHFTNPKDAVRAHARLLRPGGLLVVSIPNIRGIYRRWMADEVIAAHNLESMRLPVFRASFALPDIQPLYCGYYGQLNLGIPFRPGSALCRQLLRIQRAANEFLRIVPFPENRWTSPNLLFIGRKLEVQPAGPDATGAPTASG
jgi:SAM-dependent methyltransferase